MSGGQLKKWFVCSFDTTTEIVKPVGGSYTKKHLADEDRHLLSKAIWARHFLFEVGYVIYDRGNVSERITGFEDRYFKMRLPDGTIKINKSKD